MAQEIGVGPRAYCNYGFESTFGSAATGSRTFGHGVSLNISRRNNTEAIFGLGARNASTAAAKQYEGTASVDFILSNASIFRAILGTVTDGGLGPYTHTYGEANTVPSFSILTGTELGTNDEVTALLGCKVNSATLTASVSELVKMRLDCIYKTETLATSGIGSQVAETEEPFTFANGTLQLPSGATLADVQSVEIGFNNNIESVYGLGSRFLSTLPAKQRNYTVRMTLVFEDVSTLLTKFFGASGGPTTGTPAPSATLKLTFTNGLTSTNERTIELIFANIYLDSETLPKNPTEVIKEDVEGFALSCTSVVYTNNTSTDEGNP